MNARTDYGSLFVRLYILLIALAAGLAAAVWIGGSERFSGPSFAGPRHLVAWIPVDSSVLWGTLFFLHGMWLTFSLGRKMAIHAMRFGIVVYLFFAVSLITSVLREPVAAMTGVVVYTVVALWHLLMSDHLVHLGWERC